MSSVTYNAADNSYTMFIQSTNTGKAISTNYKIEKAQGSKTESAAYFVLEHQPTLCAAYPTNGECTFQDIYLEVEGKAVPSPQWEAKQENPACHSESSVVDAKTLKFTWDNKKEFTATLPAKDTFPEKWGFGK